MNKVESFLKGNLFPLIISVGAVFAWISNNESLMINQMLIMGYLLLAGVIFALYKDTSYAIPILLALMFMINTKGIGLTDIESFGFIHVVVILVSMGLITHLLRFRHPFKFGFLFLGFLLIAISYLLPLFNVPYSSTLLSISLIGFIYLALYLFFRNTNYNDIDRLMRYFFFASLILVAQLYFIIIKGYVSFDSSLNFLDKLSLGLRSSWKNADFGYGNINDVAIFLTLFSASQAYFIFKYPNKYYLWCFPVLTAFAVLLSGSRGGWLSFTLLIMGYYIFILARGTKPQAIIASSLMLIPVFLFIIEPEIPVLLYDVFIQGDIFQFDDFTSSRITLYKQAFKIFEQFPYFGAGWTYQLDMGNSNRIQIYHSTIFHTLAISGLVGAFSVAVFIISQCVLIVKKITIPIFIIGFAWSITALHGLFDNTVHMIIYTLLTIFVFTTIEREGSVTERKFPFLTE